MARDIQDIMERAVRIAGRKSMPAMAAPRVSRRPDPIQHPES